jgi:hypothetical protein
MVVIVIPPSLREVLTTLSRQVSEAGSARAVAEIRGTRTKRNFMAELLFRLGALGQSKKSAEIIDY